MSASDSLTTETSSTLADYTSPALLIPNLRGHDAAEVIKELSTALHREGHIDDLLHFYHAALNREYLCSTATKPGWALPHVRSRFLDRPWLAVGRTSKPIPWVAQAREKVRLVFLLAVPETNFGTYLSVIAGLARMSKDEGLLEAFLTAPDSFKMFDVLKQVKVRANLATA